MPRTTRAREESTADDILAGYWDEVDANPVRMEEIRPITDLPDGNELQTMDLQPTLFNESGWRAMNGTVVMEGEPIPMANMTVPTEISDSWTSLANQRRYVAEDLSTVELADEGRNVIQANIDTRARRVYGVDETSIEVGVPVPANVDRRCVVRADRRQGIESVKTE